MKTLKNFTTALLILLSISVTAQQGINYKALIKDGGGNVVANQNITIQFQILQGVGMTNVYQETHSPNTDANGIVIINIGEGAVNSGVFADIDWGSDEHHLNVQINTGGGLTDMGTTQFMALQLVPLGANNTLTWHLYAKNGQGEEGQDAVRGAKLDLTKKTPTHVAIVYDGKSIGLFLDGKQVPHKVDKKLVAEPFLYKFNPDASNRHACTIGAKWYGADNSDSVKSPVTIDEVRISKVARYSKDFTPQKRFTPDDQTIALYHFDAGQGDLVKDASGNGYDRKRNGATWVKVDRSD